MGKVDLAMRSVDVGANAFERLFAIKRLRGEYAEDPGVVSMLLDEARIAGLIRHPNVVSVLDVAEDDEGPYLLMEFVEGVSVAQLVRTAGAARLPLEVALSIVIQAAEGLHAAHELKDAEGHSLQLVHRDVSPQNILVGYDGVARVTDFGIAKAVGRETRTSTGILKGKIGYLSPEQLRFEDPDRRADLFALGVTLFEMLAGSRLYAGGEVNEIARRILTEPPPDIQSYRDDVPPEVDELLFELLAKKRELRPASAREVARRLEEALRVCAPAEGGVEVGDYVESLFASEHAALRHTLQRFRETATLASVRAPHSEPTPTVLPIEPRASAARRTRWVVVAAAVAGSGLALWWGLDALVLRQSPPAAASPGDTQEATPAVASPAAAAPSASVPAASTRTASEPSAAQPPVASAAPAASPSAPSPPTKIPTRKPVSKKGLPLWEDY